MSMVAGPRNQQRLWALGVLLVVLALFRPGLLLPASLSGGQTLGGALVSASSFVPIFASRRDKIAALFFLLSQYQQQAKAPMAAEIERLDQRFWQLLDKNLGG